MNPLEVDAKAVVAALRQQLDDAHFQLALAQARIAELTESTDE